MSAVLLYTKAASSFLNKLVDWDTDTIKASLHLATYTPDQNNHDFFDDVTNELTATGYTAGGVTLTTCAITPVGGASHAVKFTADPASWASLTGLSGALKWVVLYRSTGTASTSPLIGYGDLGSVSPNGAYSITWDPTNGVFSTSTP